MARTEHLRLDRDPPPHPFPADDDRVRVGAPDDLPLGGRSRRLSLLPRDALEHEGPEGPGQRRVRPVQGPRRPSSVGRLRRGRDHPAREPARPAEDHERPRRSPHAADALGQGGDRLPRPGAFRRRRHGPGPAARQVAGPDLRPHGRRRMRRGPGLGGGRRGGVLEAPQPRRGRRRQPAGPVRPDHAPARPRRPEAQVRGLRLGRHRRRRPQDRQDPGRPQAGREEGPSDGPPGPDPQRQRGELHRGQERLARQAPQGRRAGPGARGARLSSRRRCAALHPQAEALPKKEGGFVLRLSPDGVHGEDGDAPGLRQRPSEPGQGQSLGRGHRRRRQELDLRRQVLRGLPRPLVPVLHRRAEHDRRGHGPGGQGLPAVHGHLRRLPDPGPRPDPHGRLFALQYQGLRLARRRQHRRGRAVPDGPRGHGHVPAHSRLRRALSRATRSRRRPASPRPPRIKGLVYLRTSRPATPVLYPAGESFAVGGSKVLRKGEGDAATVIAAGITVHEALKACEALKKEGLGLRVIDAYSVQPLDEATILREVAETGGRAVVVEDHYAAGGLGEAVAEALAGRASLVHLCVRELPRSGKPDELLERYGISASHIVRAARELLGR